MAKKTTEKDVLIVRDEKTGEISVVAGLDADGSPKRTSRTSSGSARNPAASVSTVSRQTKPTNCWR